MSIEILAMFWDFVLDKKARHKQNEIVTLF